MDKKFEDTKISIGKREEAICNALAFAKRNGMELDGYKAE